ncbi:uncharacterized protein LOC114354449 [Ostrinia furnacalis]|uniref:uncharacterized protein LOC114354449 n=1 Tax=Ostrinia furnacalis TaxID=93504 RepID=UPI00103C3BA1|nr:uncharacterized protein LOC114354449 [Ostrinia furnacalis]
MYKLVIFLALAAVLLAPALAKPQVLLDYGYYAPSYYAAPLTYSYPYAYAYSYPFYYK